MDFLADIGGINIIVGEEVSVQSLQNFKMLVGMWPFKLLDMKP